MQAILVRSVLIGIAVIAFTVTPAHAQNKCDAGKLKCMTKKTQCLLKVYEKAIKKGEVPDAAKLAKCREKFEDPEKGCVAKLEGKQNLDKPETICTTVGNTVSMEADVDTAVAIYLDSIEMGGTPNPTPTPTPAPGPACGSINPSIATQCFEGSCPDGEECTAVVTGDPFTGSTFPTRCGCVPIPACGKGGTFGCVGSGCVGSACPASSFCFSFCDTLLATCACFED